jgi:hypothetical protein
VSDPQPTSYPGSDPDRWSAVCLPGRDVIQTADPWTISSTAQAQHGRTARWILSDCPSDTEQRPVGSVPTPGWVRTNAHLGPYQRPVGSVRTLTWVCTKGHLVPYQRPLGSVPTPGWVRTNAHLGLYERPIGSVPTHCRFWTVARGIPARS